jgi:hypothetical protein
MPPRTPYLNSTPAATRPAHHSATTPSGNPPQLRPDRPASSTSASRAREFEDQKRDFWLGDSHDLSPRIRGARPPPGGGEGPAHTATATATTNALPVSGRFRDGSDGTRTLASRPLRSESRTPARPVTTRATRPRGAVLPRGPAQADSQHDRPYSATATHRAAPAEVANAAPIRGTRGLASWALTRQGRAVRSTDGLDFSKRRAWLSRFLALQSAGFFAAYVRSCSASLRSLKRRSRVAAACGSGWMPFCSANVL